MNNESIKNRLVKALTELKSISRYGWVSGKDVPILSIFKAYDLTSENCPAIKSVISSLKQSGVLVVKENGERDYDYTWNKSSEFNESFPALADVILEWGDLRDNIQSKVQSK